MAGIGPVQMLRWFPAAPPGQPCPPERAQAREQAREDAWAEAVRTRVARVPQPSAPPVGRGTLQPGPGQALADALGHGGDIATLLRHLTDAVYDAAVISNPGAFALSVPSGQLTITPGSPGLAADNQGDGPLFVRVKAATDGSGVATNLYVAANRSDAASGSASAPISLYTVAPTVDLILNGYGQVWVDGTAPPGASSFVVKVVSFQLNGRATVYPR